MTTVFPKQTQEFLDAAETDEGIRMQARSLLHAEPAFSKSYLDVCVHDRWITVEGFVADAEEAALAEACLKRLRGIRGIDNKVHVVREGRKPLARR
jgi:osmotically-inducible protein OsmY